MDFQRTHGFDTDGICGPRTWDELVRSGFGLGDRLLYLQAPMVRGEDVAVLQRRLSTLGFDTGRIDGIFGPETLDALTDFQRNVGLLADGICGPATIGALDRCGGRIDDAPIAVLREQERMRSRPVDLASTAIAISEPGGFGALAAGLRRAAISRGATVLVIHHPDGSVAAKRANVFGADVLLGLTASDDEPGVAYYEVPGFVSVGGRALAEQVSRRLCRIVGHDLPARGIRSAIVRESRMPATVIALPARSRRGDLVPRISTEWIVALSEWLDRSDEDDPI